MTTECHVCLDAGASESGSPRCLLGNISGHVMQPAGDSGLYLCMQVLDAMCDSDSSCYCPYVTPGPSRQERSKTLPINSTQECTLSTEHLTCVELVGGDKMHSMTMHMAEVCAGLRQMVVRASMYIPMRSTIPANYSNEPHDAKSDGHSHCAPSIYDYPLPTSSRTRIQGQ